MKKLLLSLFTLIAFTGNMWGWTEGLRDSDEALGVGKTREYELPDGKSNPTKFHFSVASFCYWFDYDVQVRKYTGDTYTEESIHFDGEDFVRTYHNATVTLSKNVTKVVIINTNTTSDEYIHDVVWEGEDPAVGNCYEHHKEVSGTAVFSSKTVTLFSNNEKRKPVITFDYEATKFGSFEGKIELLVNNKSVWSTTEHGLKGTCSYQCTSNKNTIAIKYWGKVDIENIKLTQAKYVEINDDSDILFGDVKTIGSTWDAKTFSVKWASYHGKVTCTSNQFTVSPETIGNTDDCKYSEAQVVTVKFEPNQPGLHTGYVYVGNDRVKITGEAKLAKPAVTATATGKGSISLSWSALTGADSYNIYAANGDSIDNVKDAYYTISGLDEKTKYGFKIKGISGVGKDYDSEMSDVAYATTYTTSMATEITGVLGSQGTVNVTSTDWNEDEKSYAIGSTATVVANLPASCEVESIVANGVDVTATAQFEVKAENSVVVTYRYAGTGVAEVNNTIYETLPEAVEAANSGATINLLNNAAQNMVVNKYIRLNGNNFNINNLSIKELGKVELTGNVSVIENFSLEITTENCGQFIEDGGQITVTGKAYIDKTFDASGVSKERNWYSVSVPFPVSYNDGVYLVDGDGTEKLLTFNKDFIIKEYDGDLRAASKTKIQGWVLPTTDDMVPGRFYLLGIARNGMNVFRFYKKSGMELVTENKTLELKKHQSDNILNAGWNGVGNSQLYHVGIEDATYKFAQVLVGGKFITVYFADNAFSVTTPMFIQAGDNGYVSLNKKSDGTLRSASVSSDIYNLRLTAEGEASYSDQMFASASSEATGNYTIGRDLAKFEISTAYPQIYTRAFNTNLSVHQAAYNEAGVAEMPLYLFAPAAGNYTLSLGSDVLDGTALVLVKDGAEIHNFNADGDYSLYLAKGTNNSYSLRIKGENGDIATPVADDKADNIKVYVKESVLVIEGLAEGEAYTVGDMVRTLQYGRSNGTKIELPLVVKGVYWVKAGDRSVKVLNN